MDVINLGQVFTRNHTTKLLISLIKNKGNVLEPSCGDGAISSNFKKVTAIEFDKTVCPSYAINDDFFNFSIENKFSTVIGNPPFVKYKDILNSTKNLLKEKYMNTFDERSNLYLFFIMKSIEHLKTGGELIFINPREFLKATSSIKLNNFLFENGTITDLIDLGDEKLFGEFAPNCVIWRFEKGNFSRKTNFSKGELVDNEIKLTNKSVRNFTCSNGQLIFTNKEYSLKFSDLFTVKVGAVSGCDEIFKSSKGTNFVTSKTVSDGKTKKFIYNSPAEELLPFKEKLLNRKIKKFTEDTWYLWGRNLPPDTGKRIYVNCKTRNKKPFFYNKCKNFDGSVLGLFLKNNSLNEKELIEDLNKIDWEELGFVCNGRFIFSQKALENTLLPLSFKKYIYF